MAAAATALATPVIGELSLGTVLSGAGTIMNIFGATSQADAMRATAARNAENARIAAEAEQRQLEYQAGQTEAAGQHKALEDRRKATLMLSRAQAVAAASGGGPLDESLMAGIVGEGERQVGYTMYEANERAAGLRYRGQAGAYRANAQGRADIEAANRAADATLLGAYGKAGMSLFSRFAPSGMAAGAGDRGISAAIDGGFWEY